MIMQGQGRKGASGRGGGIGVRRSRSVPEQPAPPRRGRTGRKEGEKTRCLFIEQWDKLWNDDNDSRHKTEAVGFIGDTKMCSGVQTLQKPQRRATPRVVLVLALRLVTRESRQPQMFFRPVIFF